MIRQFPLASLLIALAASALALHATAYVVDAANPAAADTNTGSEAVPWKTIQHAADQAAPGNIIFVCEGTYAERLTLKRFGDADRWITLKSVPPRAAQLVGINAGRAQYVRIEGFKTVNPDKTVKGGGINLANADHIDIVNNYIENGGTGIAGERTLMDETRGHSPTDIKIAYNELYHCEFGIIAAGTRWLLESNEIHRLPRTASPSTPARRARRSAPSITPTSITSIRAIPPPPTIPSAMPAGLTKPWSKP